MRFPKFEDCEQKCTRPLSGEEVPSVQAELADVRGIVAWRFPSRVPFTLPKGRSEAASVLQGFWDLDFGVGLGFGIRFAAFEAA